MDRSWREEPIAGIIPEAGNSTEYKTGSWRTYRPVWYEDRCIQCMACFFLCPEGAILTDDDGKMRGIDYDFCKGCGICANECKAKEKALEMVLETASAE